VPVEAYITAEYMNLTNVPAMIMVFESAFGDPDHVATAE
jgi:hypothetical protein